MSYDLPVDYCIFDLLIDKKISFALYRLPSQTEPVLIIGKSEQNIHFEHIADLSFSTGFVMAPFRIDLQTPLIFIQPDKIVSGKKLIAEVASELLKCKLPNLDSRDKSIEPDLNSFDRYRESFEKFYSVLEKGDIAKLVLSRSSEYSRSSAFSVGRTFQKAVDKYSNAFIYLCHTPECGTWLGCSPEPLLTGQGERWQTVALAGTKYTESGAENLVWDEKNRTEQRIVAEYMEEQLQSLDILYTESDPHVIQAGKLLHLESDFEFRMNKGKIGRLLETLHPTPAVCGFPKDKAYDFIVENEGYERKYYAGFLGPVNIEECTNLYVNLRCMEVDREYFKLYAGGGLLASSDLMDEWLETEYKQQTLLSIID